MKQLNEIYEELKNEKDCEDSEQSLWYMAKKIFVEQLQNDDKITLQEMYNICAKHEFCDYKVETQDIIRQYIAEQVVDYGDLCSSLLHDIETNESAEYFDFDFDTAYAGAKPIRTKEDLAKVILR